MFGMLYNAIGMLSVSEDKNVITVRGINGHKFAEDIQNQWNTSKIYNNIFKKSSGYGFEIDAFFAVDLLYTLGKILSERGRLKGSRRQYESLVKSLIQNTWLRDIENPVSSRLDYEALSKMKLKLFEHQMNFLKVYDDRSTRYRLNGYILGAAPGSGKALANNTPVKTKDGWQNISDLKVGDLVATRDGTYTSVTGVFPQGELQLYDVEFFDGRIIRCCAEHLWKYHTNGCENTSYWRVGNTSELMEQLKNSKVKLYIPLVEPVRDDAVKHMIDPYTLGVTIGAGLDPRSFTDSAMILEMNRLQMFDAAINERSVPLEYMCGSAQQRLDIVQGLMDTLGHIDKLGNTYLLTDSKPLARSVQQLIYSLGGVGGIIEKSRSRIFNGGVVGGETTYQLSIRVKSPADIFRNYSSNEVKRVRSRGNNLKLKIVSIKAVGTGMATCISVANKEKLFVASDYIVTHNTITNFALSECLKTNTTIIIVPKNSVDRVWKDTLETLFKEVPTYWISSSGEPITAGRRYYVAHYEQLENVVNFASRNRLGKTNIVLDESHNFNDIKSARTQMLCELVKVSKSISTIFASGTPVKAMGSEVIPILRCIDPYFFPKVEERFKKVFGLSTSRGLDILANRMGLITFKVDKAITVGNQVDTYEVDVKTPTAMNYTLDKIRAIMSKFIEERMKYYKDNLAMFHSHYFQALEYFEHSLKTNEEWAEYKKYRQYASIINKGYDPVMHVQESMFCNGYEKNVIIPKLPSTMKESFKNAKSVYKYYHLKVQGEALGRILGKMRTQCNVEMVQAMDNYTVRPSKHPLGGQSMSLEDIINQGKKKTVIFTSYVEVVDTVNEMLKARGFNPVVVYGDTNKNLAQLIEGFEKNPDLNPVIATYPSLSTAVPLVMANQAVMLNAPFRIHEYEQAVSRMDRIGQTEIVNVFNIYLDTGKDVNISTRSVDIMAWSKSQVDAIMGISTPTNMVGIESMLDNEIDIVTNIALENCGEGDHYIVSQIIAESKKRKLSW